MFIAVYWLLITGRALTLIADVYFLDPAVSTIVWQNFSSTQHQPTLILKSDIELHQLPSLILTGVISLLRTQYFHFLFKLIIHDRWKGKMRIKNETKVMSSGNRGNRVLLRASVGLSILFKWGLRPSKRNSCPCTVKTQKVWMRITCGVISCWQFARDSGDYQKMITRLKQYYFRCKNQSVVLGSEKGEGRPVKSRVSTFPEVFSMMNRIYGHTG